MRPRRILLRTQALLLTVLVGCSGTPRVVRTEAGAEGRTLLHIPRTLTTPPVELSQRDVTEALRRLARQVRLTAPPRETVDRLFQLDAQYGDYLYLMRERKLIPIEAGSPLEGALTQEEQALVDRYLLWCQNSHRMKGDCLGGALVAGKYLDLRGRYLWAMALSKGPVLEEFQKALGEMVDMRAVLQAAMATIVMLLVLLAMPEPVTKFVAAWATTALILWIGASTLYDLITGWFQLMEEVKLATTFEQLRDSGERFGRLFSRRAAQVFAMVAMALLAHTTKGFAEQMATLPGSAQVSMQAGAKEGLLLSEVGAVESVAVTAEGFTISLAPSTAAMAVRGGRVQKHHMATIANEKSTLRGGPWTPRFKRLFAKAGMRLKDPENIVPIEGHQGPHPQEYHQLVFERLDEAVADCQSVAACREKLVLTLRDLARDIATPGTPLNQLVTLGKPR